MRVDKLETVGNGRFLQAKGVCRRFETSEGLLEVLKGVDLEVSKGSMIAITGESGVGKSTL
ncbi:MAG: ATP-binding cassette domain-containing protein, partial [candidate division Zixibacteria bacterium]|nr:ATP-binding cassette domain-containing protein [candidate division Zixibacteria bacterium]